MSEEAAGFAGQSPSGEMAGPARVVRCSFCGKSKESVRAMVTGPGVFICNECVRTCLELMLDEGMITALDLPPARGDFDWQRAVAEGWRAQWHQPLTATLHMSPQMAFEGTMTFARNKLADHLASPTKANDPSPTPKRESHP